MALASLDLSSILSATGWTGATVANLTTANDVRATDGRPAELISAELADVPTDWIAVSGDVLLKVEARTLGTVSRAKSLLLELLDGANNVLGSGSTASLTGTDAVYTVTLTGRTDDQAAANAWRIRATVQEGSGMADSATVEIDRLWVEATYSNAIAGDGAVTLSLTAAGAGEVPIEGQGQATLALTASGAGVVPIEGQGQVTLALTASGEGSTAGPIEGDGAVTLVLTAAGAGVLPIEGDGQAVLALVAAGAGEVPIEGDGAVLLALTASGMGTNQNPPDPPQYGQGRRHRVGAALRVIRGRG